MSTAGLFAHLVDDAAMFPPGNLPLAEAVPAHHQHRRAAYADLVGSFVCTDEHLPKVAAASVEPIAVSVVVTGGAGGIEPVLRYAGRSANLELRAIEIRLRAEDDLARNAARVIAALNTAPNDGAPAFVETGLDAGWQRALDVVAEAGQSAKLRTGGVDPVPSPGQVAGFIEACLDREVPFKCTAGLHRAVRSADQHGFLNVLLATRASLDGATGDELTGVLEETDGAALAARVRELTATQATGTRRWFVSYGSCSIAEPLEDLAALGLEVTG